MQEPFYFRVIILIVMKRIFIIALSGLVMSSCVSSKIHKELQAKYKDLEDSNIGLREENDQLKASLGNTEDELKSTKESMAKFQEEHAELKQAHETLESRYRDLNKNYEFLLENNNALLASNQAENKKLIEKLDVLQRELQAKEDSLSSEQQRLEYLSQELQKREARVYELESMIAEQNKQVEAIRNRLKEALFNFEGKGLTVEQRNGKVYVSLENSLLFASASWNVDGKGKEALEELAKVLAENPDLNVMVEGHTDADAFNGRTAVKDNWDLSVMRATSIVKILTANKGVDPAKITAAGRSEYIPIADNESAEGKAKNRRTEIIITPDLDAIVKVLGEVQ